MEDGVGMTGRSGRNCHTIQHGMYVCNVFLCMSKKENPGLVGVVVNRDLHEQCESVLF